MVEDILKLDFNIIGVVTPRINLPTFPKDISKVITYKPEDSMKIANLDIQDLDNLSTKEFSKLQLASSLGNQVIVLYDFSKGLNRRELNYFKIIFKRITMHGKKIILVSRDIDFLAMMCDHFAIYTNRIVYSTDNIFDDRLYNYIDMPKIVKFIKYANSKGASLQETIDINELMKDIYRRLR